MERESSISVSHAEITLKHIENIIAECKLSKEELFGFKYGRKILIQYIKVRKVK